MIKRFRLAQYIRNSRLHFLLCAFLEKFEMEGFTLSYSQAGEDLLLKNMFGKNKRTGFYIDVGCNNPIQKSNTFKLYLKGWRGICIDGNEMLMRRFRKIRKRDICLHEILSDDKRDLTFYQNDSLHELSTVDPGTGEKLAEGYKNLKKIKMRSNTLNNILETCSIPEKIDLLCVDVENHDLEVLKGNNFNKFRPEIICTEFHGSMDALKKTELNSFLAEQGYEVHYFSPPNVFYKTLPNLPG